MRRTLPVTVITRTTMKWVFFENFVKNNLVTYLPVDQHDNEKSFSYAVVSLECCLSPIILGHLHPRASSGKTRGFHTQLDEGPEIPLATREASGVPFLRQDEA